MSEFLDVLDPEGLFTGETKPREKVHKDGDWHASIHLWFVLPNGIVLQKRSSEKESFPDCFDATVAGHVDAGETCATAAVRECYEEVGLSVQEKDVIEIGILPLIISNTATGFLSREFNHIFVCKLDTMPEFEIDKNEISELQQMRISEVEREVLSGNSQFCVSADEVRLLSEFLDEATFI